MTFLAQAFLVAALAYAIIYGFGYYRKRLGKQMQEVATDLGFAFHADEDTAYHTERRHPLFNRGESRRTMHRVEGTREVGSETFRVSMGDHCYQRRSLSRTDRTADRNETHVRYVLLCPPWPPMPNLIIKPTDFEDRFRELIGDGDIDFADSPEFSAAFTVRSSSEEFARAVLTREMMTFLMTDRGFGIHFANGECLILGVNPWSKPETLLEALYWGERFLAAWPRKLVER